MPGQDVKKVQEVFTKTVNPVKDKVRINRIKTTKNVVIVDVASECEGPRKRNPLVIFYDVPVELNEEDITERIRIQNFEDIDAETFKEEFKLRFRTGPRDCDVVHHVAEVTGKLWKYLTTLGRVYLGFSAINVKDYLVVPRCHNCYDLDHVIKYCSKKPACSKCGSDDHTRKECKKPTVCIPCTRRGKKSCNATGRNCPTYKIL